VANPCEEALRPLLPTGTFTLLDAPSFAQRDNALAHRAALFAASLSSASLGCLVYRFTWTASRGAIQHSFHANILVYIGPMDTLAIAENFKMLPLFRSSFR
jgi:hypothetical protein